MPLDAVEPMVTVEIVVPVDVADAVEPVEPKVQESMKRPVHRLLRRTSSWLTMMIVLPSA